jgi:DNA polymerase-3 subunit epsilon
MVGVSCACCGWTYAVVDVETTGLVPGVDAVVEVAVVLLDEHGEATEDWSSLVRPWRPLDAGDRHGLTDADLADAHVFAEVAGRLDELLVGRLVVGHNVGFDAAMLAAEWRRLGVERAWPTADTLDAAETVGRGRGKLAELLDGVGAERAGSAHRAGSDAEATAQAWWRLLNTARTQRRHLPLRGGT